MAKIVHTSGERLATENWAYPNEAVSGSNLGVSSYAVTHNLLQNITEIIPLVVKSVCENTPADVVNNSELGQKMIQSIVASRLTAKLSSITKS